MVLLSSIRSHDFSDHITSPTDAAFEHIRACGPAYQGPVLELWHPFSGMSQQLPASHLSASTFPNHSLSYSCSEFMHPLNRDS